VPRNKGQRYPADPPTVEEIIAVMRQTPDDRHGFRVCALIVVLWRAGLRVKEALALAEPDLDERRGSLLVRSGKGGRRREIGMDAWGWEHLRPWLAARADLPVGPLFCVIDGSTRGRAWSSAAVRLELHRLALQAGVRRRFAPHQLRHAHAIELAREGIALNIIQRQLGHANLGTTSIYLQGIGHRRDHRRRPLPTRPDDVCHCRAPALTNGGSAPALPPTLPLARAKQASDKDRLGQGLTHASRPQQ
jgi:site-specific recombinase XerD